MSKTKQLKKHFGEGMMISQKQAFETYGVKRFNFILNRIRNKGLPLRSVTLKTGELFYFIARGSK